MSEGFLRRWARLKGAGEAPPDAAPVPTPVPAPTPASGRTAGQPPVAVPPTLAEAAQLGADADFGRFVAPGVDSAVRRLALKRMFADPHFNAIDGLDIYMGDYTQADPIPAAMMAALQHARSVFPVTEEEQVQDKDKDKAQAQAQDKAQDKDKPGIATAAGDQDPAALPSSDPAAPARADPASPTRTDPAEPPGTPAITPHADETTV